MTNGNAFVFLDVQRDPTDAIQLHHALEVKLPTIVDFVFAPKQLLKSIMFAERNVKISDTLMIKTSASA